MSQTEKIKRCKKCRELGHSCPEEPFIQIGNGLGEKILIVAESPARNGWRQSGRACYTPEDKLLATGKRLNQYLEMSGLGLTIDKVCFTELAKCYLSDRKYLERSGLNCFDFLMEQMNDLKPKLIISLGVIPNKVFSNKLENNYKMGEIGKIGNAFYLPLFHPSPASPYGHRNNLKILKDLKIFDILH